MRETLKKFHDSIISSDARDTLPLLKENARIAKHKQMAIYIEGYRIRLSSAVSMDHKAFCNYMGKKGEKIIDKFVEEVTSDSYSLDFYPFKFSDYLQTQKIKPEAKELALLESSIAKTFMAPDSEPLQAQTLMTLNETSLDKFRFKPRTAMALLAFDNDVEKYLTDFREEKNPKKISKKKIYIAVVRHDNEIKRHYLLAEEYYLLKNLTSGISIDGSINEVVKLYPTAQELIDEMFAQWLQKWLMNGFFAE